MSGSLAGSSIWPQAILHLDMDAFFVNVYLLDHPEDRGKPVAVGGRPDGRGVVASASYEARRFGVHSAMPSARAVRLCPQLKLVGHHWPRIRTSSREVMAILAEFGPVEKMSVDEAYVDLQQHADPEPLAAQIRAEVKRQTGLPASVGLATSKLVAKVASDREKPEGCTIVRPGQEADFLAPLPVSVIWGIGPRTSERLASLDIRTCEELVRADTALLHREFGRQAESLQRRAQGIDGRKVEPESGPAKSISQERTFSRDLTDENQLAEHIARMAEGVAESLQRRGLVGYTVSVKFRWADFTTFTRQRTLQVAVDEAEEIGRIALAIWQENWPTGKPVRLLGVGMSNLEEPAARQLALNF